MEFQNPKKEDVYRLIVSSAVLAIACKASGMAHRHRVFSMSGSVQLLSKKACVGPYQRK